MKDSVIEISEKKIKELFAKTQLGQEIALIHICSFHCLIVSFRYTTVLCIFYVSFLMALDGSQKHSVKRSLFTTEMS